MRSRILLIIQILLCSVSCVSSSLPLTILEPRIEELAKLNSSPIRMKVIVPEAKSILGRQFLLFLPLGTVKAENIELLIYHILYRELTLCGYTPFVDEELAMRGEKTPTVTLVLANLSSYAYDLVFTRRLSCDLKFELASNISNFSPSRIEHSNAILNRFGFAPQLAVCVDSVIKEGLARALTELGLCRYKV